MKFYQNNLLPYDGEAYLIKSYLLDKTIDEILADLKWREDKIKMFGKVYEQKRRVAWYGDVGIQYTYSGITMNAVEWTVQLKNIQRKLNEDLGHQFNSVLVNLYRDGEDYMSWHADNEKELGLRPTIASLSFGISRDFFFKHNSTQEKIKLNLEHGDLLVMKGNVQEYWKHSLPKRKRVNSMRLNLTFRKIMS